MVANIGNGFNSVLGTDIAGVDTDFVNSPFGGTESKLIVKMNIGNKRHADRVFNRLDKRKRVLIRDCKSDNLTSCLFKFDSLLDRAFNILCRDIEHTLNKYRRIAADKGISDFDFFRFTSHKTTYSFRLR